MAHKRELPHRYCEKPGCLSVAKYQLFGVRNVAHGYFCRAHIDREVVRLESQEKQSHV